MLPEPTSERFKPLRSGLINLYKYEDQEFWFEHGRLLLRGNNGTGKSRVLALQLPFLFDGDISSHRVEPDGDAAKALAWHLLMDEYDDRIGYTWIEFGRRISLDETAFVTLGCGMRAIKGVSGLSSRWYFVTDKRIGQDFCLLTSNRQPLSRDQLTLILGETALYSLAQDYRREVDARLFDLRSRYNSLIELLIRLRAPQLARKLDEDRLSSALSDALPPLADSLIEDLADAFRNLDSLRDDLNNHRQIQREVGDFLKDYSRYLQTASRRRADVVRSQHSRYGDLNRDIGGQTRAKEAAAITCEEARVAKRNAELATADASSRLEALRDSPFQRDAAALDAARRQAELCHVQLDRAKEEAKARGRAVEEAIVDQESRQRQLERLQQDLTGILTKMASAAEEASFIAEHEHHLPPLGLWQHSQEWLVTTEITLRKRVTIREESITQLGLLQRVCLDTQRELLDAQNQETSIEQRVIEEKEAERRHDDELTYLKEQLSADYELWLTAVRWLHPPQSGEVIEAIVRWIETGVSIDRVLPALLEQTMAAAEGERLRELATVEHEIENVMERASVLALERDELERGRHAPPMPNVTRDLDVRSQIEGAPLWQVCDFQATLSDSDRASLEAALEAAGLLDALITTEGWLVPKTACDTFLSNDAPRDPSSTLADWLHPSFSHEELPWLTHAAIENALRHVGAGSACGEHWVDLDGRWRLGPLNGRGRKREAEHIGEGARESSRRRRLDEIERESSLINARQQVLEERRFELSITRVEAIRAERAGAPSDESIAKVLTMRETARGRLATARRDYEIAQGVTSEKRQKHRDAITERERAAIDLGLGQWQEKLDALVERWRTYVVLLERLWPTAHHWNDALQQIKSATQKLDRARADAFSAEASRRDTEVMSVETHTRYNTLNASVGTSVARLHEDIGAAQQALKEAQGSTKSADSALENAKIAVGIAEQQLTTLNLQLVETTRDRAAAIDRLRLLAQRNLFGDTHVNFVGFEGGSWSVTRAIEIAREIDRTLRDTPSDDNAWRNRQTSLLQRFNDLQTSLGAHGHQPQIEYADDSLVAIACPFHGQPLRLGELHNAVTEEITTQERLLTEREREVIENHLIGEVATNLQDLIRDAEAKVSDMNSEIERCSTSTGLTMRLKWEPRTDGVPEGLPEVRRLLLADSELWMPEERTEIGKFLHGLIQDARAGNPSGLWSDHLRQALDYRAWHRFSILRRQNDRWERLTRRRYGTGSGGEKALMLTIPQMAAAAAHYRSAARHAPRLILLDEVFVGIDSKVRAKCMGLLEAFDLDFVMTSEREWGAYSTISGLAIYQLITRPGINAVATTRWTWNGRQRTLANASANQAFNGSEEAPDAM